MQGPEDYHLPEIMTEVLYIGSAAIGTRVSPGQTNTNWSVSASHGMS